MPLGNMTYKEKFNYNKRFTFKGENYFISTWKTDNTSTGSSSNNQIKLPLESTGTYNFTVYWGDGTSNVITTWNQAETTHTYASIGTYSIKIKGTCIGFRFNNTGDRLKLLEIKKWGNLELGNSNRYFYGCANLNITATDVLKNPTMTTMYGAFSGCTSLTTCPNINTSNVNNFATAFIGCTSLNTVLNINTSLASTLEQMLYGCSSFNHDISNLSLKLVVSMNGILQNANAWSRANYDLFLIGAHTQALSTGVQSNVPFRCVPGYTLGGAAQAAHDYLSGTKGWMFTDGGGV